MVRRASRFLTTLLGAAAAGYAATAAITWFRYRRTTRSKSDPDVDSLLDRFMPEFEVSERHKVQVGAPAEITLAVASEQDLQASPVIRAIFKARALVLGAPVEDRPRKELLAELKALGWGVLAEIPGREIVLGAVTQPWKASVVFRSVPADAFLSFDEPDFVKIVVSLRAEPAGADTSVFHTETRAIATDAAARAKFRRYWALVSPGVSLIRRMTLHPLKSEAERRARHHPTAELGIGGSHVEQERSVLTDAIGVRSVL